MHACSCPVAGPQCRRAAPVSPALHDVVLLAPVWTANSARHHRGDVITRVSCHTVWGDSAVQVHRGAGPRGAGAAGQRHRRNMGDGASQLELGYGIELRLGRSVTVRSPDRQESGAGPCDCTDCARPCPQDTC